MAVQKWQPSTYQKSEELVAKEGEKATIEAAKPGDFSYGDYVESDAVKQARQALGALQKPGAYQSQWQQGINDTLNKILNREQFSYDLNGDMLYQQYKDQYVNQGKMAMMDTMGQAQAATGGYGNSYAQSVGQQAYQGYLQQLNDRVPELYQLALDKYNQEGQDLYNQYGLLADRESTDYGRYRDTVSDYTNERDYRASRYDSERSWDYGMYSDGYDRAFNEHRAERSDWESDLDRVTNDALNLYNQEYGQFSDSQTMGYNTWRADVQDDQWQQDFNAKDQYEDAKASDSSGGGSSGGGGGNTALDHVATMSSAEIVSAMQGYNVDGDNTGLATFLDDCVASGRLTEAQADSYYEKYRVGSTTSTNNSTSLGHGVGALTLKEQRLANRK